MNTEKKNKTPIYQLRAYESYISRLKSAGEYESKILDKRKNYYNENKDKIKERSRLQYLKKKAAKEAAQNVTSIPPIELP
tara:strand:- start:59 stop:298 length:240 start_codon:yes stop_codon:yes gene_type:complete